MECHVGVMYCFAAYHKARPSRAINEDVYYYYYYKSYVLKVGFLSHKWLVRQ